MSLFVNALQTAAIVALPVVIVVAAVGVLIGIVQTVVQVQDQNVAFAPKLVAVALLAFAGAPAVLALLLGLFATAIDALPRLARS